jgi:DedD protein
VAEPEAESTAIADPEAAPAKEAPAKEPVVAKPSSGKFYVQIGVFSDAANVKQLQAKLSDLGYKSQTEKINTDKGQKIRLKTQVFGDRNEAAIALENIKDAGLTGMVVSQ